ncbi:MAG TPA: Lrp/AsnC family transcriptional regulator [Anaerolineales bacterium]|nr:Lrp/AsnC family transcriptional regulator [Anaerolineales bacterium]
MALLEPIDHRILDLLMEDGRMPCAEMARRVGDASERTIRYRLQRLIDRGIVRVAPVPNPRAVGYQVVADVFLEVEPASIRAAAERLTGYARVSYVACSLGEVDISLQIVGRDNDEIYDFVTQVVANVPGVRKTTTLIVPLTLKDIHQWRIPRPENAGDLAAAGT